MDVLQALATGPTPITTSGTSGRAAIGNNAAGIAPYYIRLAATVAAYVKVGDSTVTAAAGDILVQPGDAVVVRARDFTHVAAIQVSAAGVVSITPLENV